MARTLTQADIDALSLEETQKAMKTEQKLFSELSSIDQRTRRAAYDRLMAAFRKHALALRKGTALAPPAALAPTAPSPGRMTRLKEWGRNAKDKIKARFAATGGALARGGGAAKGFFSGHIRLVLIATSIIAAGIFLWIMGLAWFALALVVGAVIFCVAVVRGGRAGKLLGALLILGLIVGYVFFTPSGAWILAYINKALFGVREQAEATAPTFNILKQVLTGTYDPSKIYTSEQYQDEYEVVKNPGVYLEDVRSLLDTYPCSTSGCSIIVFGRIRAQSISYKDRDKIVVFPPKARDSESREFDCIPKFLPSGVTILRQFQCKRFYAPPTEGVKSYSADVYLDYTFKAAAGKQFYVADRNLLDAINFQGKTPLDALGIAAEEVQSWQTQGPAGLGIGMATREDVVPINGLLDGYGDCITEGSIPHILAFTVQNNGAGDLKVAWLNVTLPEGVFAYDIDDNALLGNFKTDDAAKIATRNKEYTIGSAVGKTIAPGIAETYLVKAYVCDDFLKGQTHNSFFVLANLAYNYTEKTSATYMINPV